MSSRDTGRVTMNDVREIIEKLESQGWRIERDRKHYKAFPPDRTKQMVTIPTTPSGSRWRPNLISQLRRSGANL
jgi:predicted RNA binding protein YcfA (HicA-like mRNA interferase family)